MVLASYLVNLYDDDLSSNMESDTKVNMCNILLSSYEEQSDRSSGDEILFYFVCFSLVRIDNLVLV